MKKVNSSQFQFLVTPKQYRFLSDYYKKISDEKWVDVKDIIFK